MQTRSFNNTTGAAAKAVVEAEARMQKRHEDAEARLNAALEAKLIRQVGARLGLNSAWVHL